LRENSVLDVGEHQLLVLLLVVQAELDDGSTVARAAPGGAEQRLIGLVDVRAVARTSATVGARAGRAAARGCCSPTGVVVGVEEVREAGSNGR
jgi:hypothetical protein